MLSCILSYADVFLDIKYFRALWAAQTRMWLTVSWRLEGIYFERYWKLMSAGWIWGTKRTPVKQCLCFLSVSIHLHVLLDEFPNMRVSSVRIFTFRCNEINKKWLLLTFDCDMVRTKGRRAFQGYLGCHSWHFEGAAFSSQTARNDIYAQSFTQCVGVRKGVGVCSSLSVWACMCLCAPFTYRLFFLIVTSSSFFPSHFSFPFILVL